MALHHYFKFLFCVCARACACAQYLRRQLRVSLRSSALLKAGSLMSDPSSHFVLSTGFSANVTIPLVGTVLSTVLVNHFVAPVSADTVAALTAGLGTIVLGSVFNGTLLYFGVPHATVTGDGVPHAHTVTLSAMLDHCWYLPLVFAGSMSQFPLIPGSAVTYFKSPVAFSNFTGTATLSGFQATTLTGSTATGEGSATLGSDGVSVYVSLTVRGLSGQTNAHIHVGGTCVQGFLFVLSV